MLHAFISIKSIHVILPLGLSILSIIFRIFFVGDKADTFFLLNSVFCF